MNNFKEFEAKTIDEAIDAAMRWFDVDRIKLEVDILSDSKGGIFGLGGKKAKIRARLAEKPAPARPAAAPRREAEPAHETPPSLETAPNPEPAQSPTDEAPVEKNRRAPRRSKAAKPAAEAQEPQTRKPRTQAPAESVAKAASAAPAASAVSGEAPAENGFPDDEDHNAPPPAPRSPEEDEALRTLTTTILDRLVSPILDSPDFDVEITGPGRIHAVIHDETWSGLLIGRDGQTLAAVQYIANRILARLRSEAYKLTIDAGDYRERRNENLRGLALSLGDKAKATGRVQSTKPMSSYHRRVVHLAIQDDPGLQTRSKGEGPLKRVLIIPRRPGRPASSNDDE